uniref:DUF4283 domain-containing protein n=1 Tax=Solanum tuberosum TaxID=4113 RepID=M1CIB3_SOLTU
MDDGGDKNSTHNSKEQQNICNWGFSNAKIRSIESMCSWKIPVVYRLPREIGKRNFHPRFNGWSILSLGKVHLVAIGMNKNKQVLANVIKIPPKDLPILNDMRKWTCNSWKSTFGLNVFSLSDSQYFIEFPMRKATEHVMTGE